MNEITHKNIPLSQLFHYDIAEMKNADLRKGLREYRLLITTLQLAIDHFEKNELDKFNSLVGENACQIRAIKTAILASSSKIDFSSEIALTQSIKSKLDHLLSHPHIARLMTSGATLKEVFETEHLDLFLCPEKMFLFQSYLLTEMKQPFIESLPTLLIRNKSAPKNLKKYDAEVSSNFLDSLASKLRRQIANASVQYVRELAMRQNDSDLIQMVSDDWTEEHNSWPCTPMFWTYKILLKAAHEHSIPLIIHARFLDKAGEEFTVKDEETLYFRPVHDGSETRYIPCKPTASDLETPACIIQGVVCLNPTESFCKESWKKKMEHHSVLDIVLSGAADHRQYPNPDIEIEIADTDYEKYRNHAKANGFSLENPSTFFINHVYPQKTGKMF